MTSRYSLLALVVLACSSCQPVPFDLTLSQSAQTASKMTKDNPGSITAGYNQGGSQSGYAFYPSVLAAGGFDYSAGFVTSLESQAVDIQALAGGNQYAFTSQPLPNPDAHAPSIVVWPVKSGQSFLFGMGFDATNPTMNGYAIFQGTPSTSSLVMNPAPSGSSLQNLAFSLYSTSPETLGASVYASQNPTVDWFHMLMLDTSTGVYMEGKAYLSSTGFTNGSLFRNSGSPFSLPFVPPGISRVLYYYDENERAEGSRTPNRSFGQWWDSASGAWVTCAWWEPSPGAFVNARIPVDHRIDALLSTGQLLSTEGGNGRLYDRDGNLLATFPLGNLLYIGEQYVGGTARAYFSQCLIFDRSLHFNVYWIPTAQIASLGS